MKVERFAVPVKPRFGSQKPFVSRLRLRSESQMWCSLMFSDPSLFLIKFDSGSPVFEEFKIPESTSSSFLGIWNGFWGSSGGDTAFLALEQGFLPGWLRGLLGKEFLNLNQDDRVEWMRSQEGGLGAFVRHSVYQVMGSELRLRHAQNPGILWDVEWIGDFVFGLGPSALWREPYLNAEKRETLRKDLGSNQALFKDHSGLFWFCSDQNRLLRMEQTEVKARPTPVKLPGEGGLGPTVATHIDQLVYALTDSGRQLIRFRRNPESLEEELQLVQTFDSPATSLTVTADNRLVVALSEAKGAVLLSGLLTASEDPELLGPLPKLEAMGVLTGHTTVSSLTATAPGVLWVAGSSQMDPELLKVEI